jgi:hypothetical protein
MIVARFQALFHVLSKRRDREEECAEKLKKREAEIRRKQVSNKDQNRCCSHRKQ